MAKSRMSSKQLNCARSSKSCFNRTTTQKRYIVCLSQPHHQESRHPSRPPCPRDWVRMGVFCNRGGWSDQNQTPRPWRKISLIHQAVRTTGCTVDTLTLSSQQKALAEDRIKAAGLAGRIRVWLMDYRKYVIVTQQSASC
jgi:hypothetical protein